MKVLDRFFIVVCLMLICSSAMGQRKVYCELLGTAKLLTNKITVSVDFGQETKRFSSQTLVDESGQPIVFNSMVDAMNKMGELGWEFEQAYVVSESSSVLVYHWLLSKYLNEGEDPGDGLTTYSAKRKEIRDSINVARQQMLKERTLIK